MSAHRPLDSATAVMQNASSASSGRSAWELTLPVAAGVFLGALLSCLFVFAYLHAQNRGASFDGVSATASTTSGQGSPSTPAASDRREAEAGMPRMPGLIEAHRLQLRTACIAGTVGHRRPNGWVQAVADDAPRRCVATTQ